MNPFIGSGGVGWGTRPVVTMALIGASVLVFLYQVALNDLENLRFTYQFGLIARELASGNSIDLLRFGLVPINISSPIPTWGTVFSSMFMHGGVVHILGNMLFLWGFGERVEAKFGHLKYLVFYLATGVAAAWTQVATDQDSTVPIIGASGAISGVLGAYLLAFPYRNVTALILMFFVLPLVLDVGSLGGADLGPRIAYMAHIGGFVAGALLMAGYKLLLKEPIWPRPRRWPWES